MSKGYDEYLKEHTDNVRKAVYWIVRNMRKDIELTNNEVIDLVYNAEEHDASKYDNEEYDAYDGYFYLGVHDDDAYNRAWLHHIHNNPHHWQYWLLVNDDGTWGDPDKFNALEIPKVYVVEMLADWWSFSWTSGNLTEVFDWYEGHKDGMILHDETRAYLERLLDVLRQRLSE